MEKKSIVTGEDYPSLICQLFDDLSEGDIIYYLYLNDQARKKHTSELNTGFPWVVIKDKPYEVKGCPFTCQQVERHGFLQGCYPKPPLPGTIC